MSTPQPTTPQSELDGILKAAIELVRPLQRLLPNCVSTLEGLLAGSGGERLRIGVIGITSSGKSTFINVLLGEQLLPEKSKPVTNVPVICRRGPRRTLRAEYRTREAEIYFDADVTAELLKSLCSEDGNPNNEKDLARLIIELPTCHLAAELEIIDTPGTDAHGLQKHETITLYECIPGFDITVFMLHIARHFAQSDLKLLRRILELDQRALFLISHTDIVPDDHDNGKISRTRQQKIEACVGNLAAELNQFPELRDAGIVAVSSIYAREASGDRTTEFWRRSNFDVVLECFQRFVESSLGDVLIRARAGHAASTLKSIVTAIRAYSSTMRPEPGNKGDEASLSTEVSSLRAAKTKIESHLADLRTSARHAIDVQEVTHRFLKEFDHLGSGDVWGFRRANDKLPGIWTSGERTVTEAIDKARAACRVELERVGLPAGRSAVKRRALETNELPSLSNRIRSRTETYNVVIEPTGFLGKVRRFFVGDQVEQHSRTVESVAIDSFIADLRRYVEASVNGLSRFLDDQEQMLCDLFLDPVATRYKDSGKVLKELVAFRVLSEREAASLPLVLEGIERFLPRLQSMAVQIPTSGDPVRSAGDHSRAAPRPSSSAELAQSAILPVLGRVREGAAIERFWRTTRIAARHRTPERILLIGGGADWASNLISWLTRGRWPEAGAQLTSDEVTEVEVSHRSGQSRLVFLRTRDESDPLAVKSECERADAIGIFFYGAQPGAGLNALVNHPGYGILAGYAKRSFLIFSEAALYDQKIQDLVLDLADPVDENTSFKGCPWYVCETSRYDARYTDFIEIVRQVRALAGPARQIGREWTGARRLSFRWPFEESNLDKAGDLIGMSRGL